MCKKRTLFWRTIVFGIFLVVFSGKILALDQKQLSAYEVFFLADAGCNDPDTLLRKSEELSGLFSPGSLAPEEFLSALRVGILYHNLSLNGAEKGYRGYAEKAAEILSRLYHHPDLPEELRPISGAYLGSSLALAGGEATNPLTKIKRVKDGLKYLDTIVKNYGKNSYYPLLLRANVGIALPAFFKREKTAVEDFLRLEQWYSREPERIPSGIMPSVYLHLGNYYKKEKKIEEAIAYWRKAYELDPAGEVGAQAKALLELFAG
ncbi:MAG: tetratricopeptide repeat protein [Firmicutes bacterium]|nr:tetratricopeptide repeat protein [Bacillota bacterium]